MTSSATRQPSMNIGTEDQTSQDDAKYVSNKGTEFDIIQLPNGLYRIVMKRGGAVPDICHGKYTGYNTAQNELVRYLKKTNRLGYAIYPDHLGK